MRKWLVRMKRYEWWVRVMESWNGMVGDVVEVEGVVGRVRNVGGKWDWVGMKGHVEVWLEECVA